MKIMQTTPNITHSQAFVSLSAGKRLCLLVIILTGVAIRLYHYVDNRGLYLDETSVAVNLIEQTFQKLASPPLIYDQQAPVVFWWSQKVIVNILGYSEPALRLLPLLAGVAALGCFTIFCLRYFSFVGIITAVGLLAFAYPAVYHSVECKQYSGEMFVTVLLLLGWQKYNSRQTDLRSSVVWGVVGLVCLFCSHSSVFVLAAVAIVSITGMELKAPLRSWMLLCMPFLFWGAGFVINYLLFLKPNVGIKWLVDAWSSGYMPFPPRSQTDLHWYVNTFQQIIEYPLGLSWSFLSFYVLVKHFFLFLCLGFGLYGSYRVNRKLFAVILVTTLLVLVASALRKYPFQGRLLFFWIPLIYLLLAFGVEALVTFVAKECKQQPGLIRVVKTALPVVLLIPGLYSAVDMMAHPRKLPNAAYDIREAIRYVHTKAKPVDEVYYRVWEGQIVYYKKYFAIPFDPKPLAYSTDGDSAHLTRSLEHIAKSFAGKKRVWFIMYGANRVSVGSPTGRQLLPTREALFITEVLNRHGKCVDRFLIPDQCAAYLYSFESSGQKDAV
ncbi:MAG: hypothetical protein MUD08_11725, partial [Cytophagales bacterium]|nr:hypothetical protein [Cytophagales bacterium]